jgi:hypothetical protein
MTTSKVQNDYIAAKATVETKRSEYAAIMSQYAHLLDSEAGIDEYVDHEVETIEATGLNAAEKNLKVAEGYLLDWGRVVSVTSLKNKAERALLTELFEKLPLYPMFRERAAEIILKLDVSTI